MKHVRALIREHRQLAVACLVLAFCIRAIVPAGFMVSPAAETMLTISVCSDATGAFEAIRIPVPLKSSAPEHKDGAEPANCAFGGLGKLALGGADPFLLAVALAFILAVGVAPAVRPPHRRIAYLQPPLRGPPAIA
jgi:hypothetical protein